MNREFEVKGSPDEFEAAVIAVVLDRIAREEEAARRGPRRQQTGLPSWVRAIMPEESRFPWEQVRPD